jgi:hypothetical protein
MTDSPAAHNLFRLRKALEFFELATGLFLMLLILPLSIPKQ